MLGLAIKRVVVFIILISVLAFSFIQARDKGNKDKIIELDALTHACGPDFALVAGHVTSSYELLIIYKTNKKDSLITAINESLSSTIDLLSKYKNTRIVNSLIGDLNTIIHLLSQDMGSNGTEPLDYAHRILHDLYFHLFENTSNEVTFYGTTSTLKARRRRARIVVKGF